MSIYVISFHFLSTSTTGKRHAPMSRVPNNLYFSWFLCNTSIGILVMSYYPPLSVHWCKMLGFPPVVSNILRHIVMSFPQTSIYMVARLTWKLSWYHGKFLYVILLCAFVEIEHGYLRLVLCYSGHSLRLLHIFTSHKVIV